MENSEVFFFPLFITIWNKRKCLVSWCSTNDAVFWDVWSTSIGMSYAALQCLRCRFAGFWRKESSSWEANIGHPYIVASFITTSRHQCSEDAAKCSSKSGMFWELGGGRAGVTPVFNLENAQVLQQKRGKSGQSSLLANPVCVNTRREWKCCTLSPVINSWEKWVISFSAGEQ